MTSTAATLAARKKRCICLLYYLIPCLDVFLWCADHFSLILSAGAPVVSDRLVNMQNWMCCYSRKLSFMPHIKYKGLVIRLYFSIISICNRSQMRKESDKRALLLRSWPPQYISYFLVKTCCFVRRNKKGVKPLRFFFFNHFSLRWTLNWHSISSWHIGVIIMGASLCVCCVNVLWSAEDPGCLSAASTLPPEPIPGTAGSLCLANRLTVLVRW